MSSNSHSCPVCDGPGRLLGCLGYARHYRCIDCGNSFHHAPHRTASKPSREIPAPDQELQAERES